jgi:hypothetical protein
MIKYVKGDVSIRDSFLKNVSQRGLGSHRPHGTTPGLRHWPPRCAAQFLKISAAKEEAPGALNTACAIHTVTCGISLHRTGAKGKRKRKRKVHPRTGHEGQEGEQRCFFILGARWEWMVNATPRPLYPRERPGTHCTGGWVGFRAGLDGCGKSRPPPPGFDPRTAQPVASCSTD